MFSRILPLQVRGLRDWMFRLGCSKMEVFVVCKHLDRNIGFSGCSKMKIGSPKITGLCLDLRLHWNSNGNYSKGGLAMVTQTWSSYSKIARSIALKMIQILILETRLLSEKTSFGGSWHWTSVCNLACLLLPYKVFLGFIRKVLTWLTNMIMPVL